jgi:hypothetical protein
MTAEFVERLRKLSESPFLAPILGLGMKDIGVENALESK